MSRLFLFAAITLVAAPGVACAAGPWSLDCHRATSTVAQAICHDSELAALEEEMSRTDARFVRLTPMDVHPLLWRQQETWHADLERKCGQFPSIDKGLGQCILAALRERTAELQHEIEMRQRPGTRP